MHDQSLLGAALLQMHTIAIAILDDYTHRYTFDFLHVHIVL